MISVKQATQLILSRAMKCPAISIPLLDSAGYILKETLLADRDIPPFDRAMMDGIAIRYEDFQNGQVEFPIRGIQAAGAPELYIKEPQNCIEIMTGAVLPAPFDTVIRYEDLHLDNKTARIQITQIRKGQNIHLRGKDRLSGQVLVPPGTRIGAAEIGIAASIGKTALLVARPPTACVISTGDELVDIEATPLPYQIRKSNVYTIAAMLHKHQIKSEIFHFNDDPAAINQGLATVLGQYDLVILSGGVSAGKFDFIPGLLKENGVSELFYKIEQKPGKPFWFGQYMNQTTVFALPGNPVSSFLCTLRYMLPWVTVSTGGDLVPQWGMLAENYEFKPSLTCFLQVKTHINESGQVICLPVPGHGSGDFSSLTRADAFLELPPDRNQFVSGEAYPLWRFN